MGKDIANQSIVELIKQGAREEYTNLWRSKLEDIFPDVSKGDSIIANFSPGGGVSFFFNRKILLGRIKDKQFTRLFFDIWLGTKTSDKKLRRNLLGESK